MIFIAFEFENDHEFMTVTVNYRCIIATRI